MKFWLLIVLVTSPSGDKIERYVDDYATRVECLAAKEVLNYKIGAMGEKIRAHCIQLREPI